jgi:hypothetical protein
MAQEVAPLRIRLPPLSGATDFAYLITNNLGWVSRDQEYFEFDSEDGNPGGPGRPKGSLGRIKADLAQLILNGAAQAALSDTAMAQEIISGANIGCRISDK